MSSQPALIQSRERTSSSTTSSSFRPYRRHSDDTSPLASSHTQSTYGRKHSQSIDSKASTVSAYASSTCPTVDTALTSVPSSASSSHPISKSKISSTFTSARHRFSSERSRPLIPALPPRARAFSEDNYTYVPHSIGLDGGEDYAYDSSPTKHHHHLPTKVLKPKIKPLLKLAKPSSHRSSTSLDLSQPGGGSAGLHLGLGGGSDTEDYEDERYGRSSLQLPSHRRNMSGQSLGTGNASFMHPMRQVPRGYTSSPAYSYAGSSVSSLDSENGMPSMRHSLERTTRPVVPTALRIRTDSTNSTSVAGSPISPLSATIPAFNPMATPISASASSATTVRPPASPSYEASLNAARMAWDLKEAQKAEKEERKRRKSEQKEARKSMDDSANAHKRSCSSIITSSCVDRCNLASHDPLCGMHGSKTSLAIPRIFKHTRDHSHSASISSPVLPIRQPTFPSASTEPEKPSTFVGGITLAKQTPATQRRRSEQGLKARWMSFMIWMRTKMWRLKRKLRRMGPGGKRAGKSGMNEKSPQMGGAAGGMWGAPNRVVVGI